MRTTFWLVVLSVVLCGRVQAEGGHNAQPAPGASLTLIPPSPVTDQIALEIRGAVRNSGQAAKTFDLAFYLDEETGAARLHRETIEVAGNSAKAVFFRWPTKAHAGRHRILFAAKSASETRRMAQPIEILASKNRSTKQIGGAWVSYNWTDPGVDVCTDWKLTDADWREVPRGMHKIGMDIIVLQDAFYHRPGLTGAQIEKDGYPGLAYYPSRLYPGRWPMIAKDPTEAIMAEADKLGMQVFIGAGGYAWRTYTPDSLKWHMRVASELWERYGHHPSFYGWYVTEEGEGVQPYGQMIVDFFREFQGHCRSMAPDKPLLLAPNTIEMHNSIAKWRAVLEHCDIICPFGFHRFAGGDQAARGMQKLCDETGAHLWMDLEVFTMSPWASRPIAGIVSDLDRWPNFEKVLCYRYPGFLTPPDLAAKLPNVSPKMTEELAIKLYKDYQEYLRRLKAHATAR
jgi:hypothetical protein